MSDNLNIKLLKQHAAILETVLQTVNNVSKSITEEAATLDAELAPVQDATEALVRARFAEAKLNKAVADLRFVMAGGDPCRVCAVKCTFGEGNCKPVWRGEAGADL